jgi:hypothetical protein
VVNTTASLIPLPLLPAAGGVSSHCCRLRLWRQTEAELQLVKKATRVALLEAMASNSTMASLLCEFQALRGAYRPLARVCVPGSRRV